MFENCKSLLFLNLYSFKLNVSINKTDAFKGISSFVRFCINDTDTKNLFLENNKTSNCNDNCFQNDIKIDFVQNTCLKSCVNNGYKFEYNNICYNECPNYTYPLFCEKKLL